MKRISRRYLNKVLKTVMVHCDQGNTVWADDSLKSFCESIRNRNALNMLEELESVSITYGDGGPYVVSINSGSYIYLLTRKEVWIERTIGLVSGVAATLLTEYIVCLISKFLLP